MPREYKLKKSSAPGPSDHVPDGPVIDFVAQLNPEQYAAVTSPPGQALVIAGAGSGKTRTLTYRVAYLLQNRISPANILLLTFTNKAAREMLERVDLLLPGRAGGIWGGTFHSICNRILRRHPDKVGLSRNFTILDAEDQKSLLSKVIKETKGLDEVAIIAGQKFPKAPVIMGIISLAQNTRRDVFEVAEQQYGGCEEMVSAIVSVSENYRERKRAANSVDFDDLLLLTLQLFTEQQAILADYQYQFQFILVDEYQDTNALQGELVDLLAAQHGNLMVVGDDAQSIYSWRGADVNYIIGFPQRYPKSKIYRIETNYRSTPEVLALANDSIQHNHAQFEKNLKACRKSGMKPALVALRNPSDQASFVAQRIHELVEENGLAYSDIAVLYRAHFQSMEVQLEFTTQQIPFQITSGLRFFEQAHIKDFTAFLRLAVNPQDEAAFDRLVQLLDGVGGVGAQKLWQQWKSCDFVRRRTLRAHVSETLLGFKLPPRSKEDWEQMAYTMDEFVTKEGELVGPVPMMKSVWEGIYSAYVKASFDNAEQRQQDIEQLRRFAERFETVEQLLTELSLLSGPESATSASDKERDSVTLSSIHQAKGLEWKVVFVIWLAASMFPNPRAVDEGGSEALEEERRLFYVAATRAMDQLYLTYPHFWQRAYDGDAWQLPSLFLSEIDSSRVEEWRVGV